MISTINMIPIQVLLVEDNPGDVELTRIALARLYPFFAAGHHQCR